MRARAGSLACSVAPVIFLAALHHLAFATWFFQDDFGWLSVPLGIHHARDVIPALFLPQAHGNLRPWSETGYFALLSTLFGRHPLPFRICAFAVQAGAMFFAGALVRRLT